MPRQGESQERRTSNCPELVLWRSVIEQARRDLTGKRQGGRSEADNVISWVGTADFHRVCIAADLDPEATEKEFRRVIEERGKNQ